MIRPLAAALAMLAAGQAAALSCIRPDVAAAYTAAAEADESYVVLLGRLDFRPSRQPPDIDGDVNQPRPAPPVRADFSGKSLASNGFTREFSAPVMLEPVCWAAWCGGFPVPGQEVLLFARTEGSGGASRVWVELNPCGTQTFDQPTRADIRRVEACHQGGPCTAAHR